RRQDDAVADAPTGNGLGQGDVGGAGLRRGVEFEPGAAQRGAVKVHAAAAADDGRTRFLVHAVDVVQADEGGRFGGDGLLWRADQQRRRRVGRGGQVGVAVKPLLVGGAAGPDADQPDFQARVAVGGERQRAVEVQRADYLGLGHVVADDVPGLDVHL